MTAQYGFFDFLWSSFLLLAPMLLLGLFLAGVIHVLISREAILKWLHKDNLTSLSTSAAMGVPMPLCSCSVVPVVAEMRRKGASRSSCMSFLITAPETGADSILVTHAFFGFVPAVVRPVISFVTAVVAGLFCIGLIRDRHDPTRRRQAQADHTGGNDCCHGQAHKPLQAGDDCYVSPAQLGRHLLAWLGTFVPRLRRPRPTPAGNAPAIGDTSQGVDFPTIGKHILRYGFVEVADDILFALIVGVALGSLLYLAIPDDLMSFEYARWLAYPAMVLVGVPIYICASASTPIAAALVAKGFSPGAALIFLMTGPATNTGTIAIIVSQFGTRFAGVYVAAVVAVTVVLGIVIDLLLFGFGLTLTVNLDASESPALLTVQWGGAIGLLALVAWRFHAGALKRGFDDMMANLRPLAAPWRR